MDTNSYINQQLITEIIADKLRKEIETDVLKPGERIGEAKVSEKYNVSRTPVREAFRILGTEGYLTHSPRCGVIVRTVDKREIEEIFEIRAWNEQLMVRKVVEDLTEETVQTLTEIRDQMQSLRNDIDEERFQTVDSVFHEVLVNHCTNKHLGETIKGLKVSTKLFRSKAGFSENRAKASLVECSNIIDSILEKNADEAANRMKIHFQSSLDFFLKHYPMP